ncbi:MAG: Aminotransferase, DegT/DnrJ/EryC1/StrS family [Candidatus Bipolaricaulis sibiricus]|uniref:Aminotransferase, DegT/DnrJ/EryC1/StrS family n=1 Tax=Bipolaricaulis sibiricus TaxID=2501609 RepID=A0A410FTL5_BIPS1|nr:MAG: Aminotransferase, DegT/DnrJ/EryC1/StrS family [Candidatus Bipolaricaulis sibiricus]
MTIPILDLTRQYAAIKPEIDAAVQRVVESGRFILGPEVEALEKAIAAYCRATHAIGVASGTDALLLSLRAVGVGPGDGVIVPSFTFFATAGVVHNVGAAPIFCDIDPQTFNLSPTGLRRILTSDHGARTQPKAVIPVHLYGQMADMDEIMELAHEFGLYVIEDAAQAIGAEYKGRKAGTIGHLGCFSFFPTKNLGAYGDGGMVVTDDDELAERVRMLRVHGSKPKYYHHIVGYNSRLDALQAAVLRAKLPHLDEWTAARRRLAARYDELLARVSGIVLPHRAAGRTHIFHQYTIRVADGKRDALREHLKAQGIGTEIYYPLPLHLQQCFAHLGYQEGDLPESEKASREALSLPMFPELTDEEQAFVTNAIRSFLSSSRQP